MAHKFDRSDKDPYVEAAHQVERNLSSGRQGFAAGADSDIYSTLGDAVVSALGDIAATAFRNGVNDPGQIKGLAKAIAGASEAILTSYAGEVDPRAAIQAMKNDPRLATLAPEAQDKLRREIDKTYQIEELILNTRRLPALIDYAGSLGLHIQEDAIEEGEILVSADTHQPPPPDR